MSLVHMRRQMKYMMFVVWGFIAIFVLSAVFSYSAGSFRGGSDSGAALFAKVDGHDVTVEQFRQNLDGMRNQYRQMASFGQAASLQQYAELPRYAWDQVLEEYAQAAAAEKQGINVSLSEADKELRKTIDEQLKTVGAGATPQELERAREMMLAARDAESQRRQMLGQRLRDTLAQKALPVEVKVAHVLIKAETRTEDTARKLAEDISRQAKAGSDFGKLATQHSEDQGSKIKGGEVGWASAQPPSPPTGKDAKPDPNAATNFVPEFTAAALLLKKGEVSEPVRSTFGYHVLKALDVRDFKPKLEGKPDDKKRQEAIDQYKNSAGTTIAQGLVSEQKQRLETTVQPKSPWLVGYIKENAANSAPMVMGKDGKPVMNEAQKLGPAIDAYAEALGKGGPEVGPPLAYKLATLYQRADRNADADALLVKWTKKSANPDLYFLHGEILEKLKKKTEAVAAYQKADEYSYNNPDLLNRVADKLKGLGRNDLALKTREKSAKQVAQQVEERARREKARADAEKAAKAEAEAAKKITTKPVAGDAKPSDAKTGDAKPGDVQEITVKTGPIDPKTGKPTIVSVTPGGKDTKDAKPDAKDAKSDTKAPAKP